MTRSVRNFLVTALRCLGTFIAAAIAATALAMLSSKLLTLTYRAYYHVPASRNLIEDLRYVTYHSLIVMPVFLAVLILVSRWVWRWSRKFQSGIVPRPDIPTP